MRLQDDRPSNAAQPQAKAAAAAPPPAGRAARLFNSEQSQQDDNNEKDRDSLFTRLENQKRELEQEYFKSIQASNSVEVLNAEYEDYLEKYRTYESYKSKMNEKQAQNIINEIRSSVKEVPEANNPTNKEHDRTEETIVDNKNSSGKIRQSEAVRKSKAQKEKLSRLIKIKPKSKSLLDESHY
ncbi:MAG: hypothetical protein MHMPM18_000126 [Marteilia pararefringens]